MLRKSPGPQSAKSTLQELPDFKVHHDNNPPHRYDTEASVCVALFKNNTVGP